MSLERYDEAISRCLIAQRLAPDNVEIQLRLVDAYNAAGTQALDDSRPQDASDSYNCALAICDVVLRLDPKNAAIYDKRGEVLVSEGRLIDGLGQFNSALSLNHNLISARVDRAGVLFRIGMEGDSEKVADSSRELNEILRYCSEQF